MIVLGIDPGYAIVGYGIIYTYGGKYKSLDHGAILTTPDQSFDSRLSLIYDNLKKILKSCKPDAVSIEKLYFQNNQKTAIQVAEARGVIILACSRSGVPIYEYTPLQVKTAVTGYGKSPKRQVMEMTKRLLNLDSMPKLDDTCDSLAIAICHANIAFRMPRYIIR